MIKNNPTNVFAAFEILLEEIETEVDVINKAGARAFEEGAYDSVPKTLERANQLTAFRDKVAALRKEWVTLAALNRSGESEDSIPIDRRNLGRLHRGVRTPETTFYQPILKALVQAGGSAKMNDLLVKLEPVMKGSLTQVDYEPVASYPDMPRWRNTACWARYSMVKEGLMKSDSPRGVWEISEAGRKFLREEAR